MRFVPFFNVSYVKSGFHLMTVAPSRRLAGAASNAFSMSAAGACASALVDTASKPRKDRTMRFIRKPPIDMCANVTRRQYPAGGWRQTKEYTTGRAYV